MKKIFAVILCVVMLLGSFPLVGCTNRATQLKVYNVGEYMDDSVIDGFADWYYEETGEKVEVMYKTYSTNEDMYTEIYKKNADYDVVLGSDYILTRMIKNKLVKPINRELIYGEAGESGVIDSDILGFVNEYENYDGRDDYADTVRYSVPYMWGTFGIMYRYDKTETNRELFDWKDISWDVLFDKPGVYEERRYMKNSVRDAYASAAIMAHRETLSELSNGFTDYNDTYYAYLKTIINDTSSKNMSTVKSTLKNQKQYVLKYESDFGKDDMIKPNPEGYYGLFWSCDAGYAMTGDDDIPGCTDLYYGVPKEGSNVWVDSFVIPKYCENEKAAQYFLKYLCEYDQAYLNRDYAGCSSPVTEVAQDTEEIMRTAWDIVCGIDREVSDDIAEDVEYYVDFFSDAKTDDFGEMFIEMLFPTKEVLSRCAVMKDSDKNACIEMAKMWISVKAS